jgi:hypothetical protein
MSPLCSRNARSQKTLVGRAQWRAQSGYPGRTATSKLGRAIVMCSLRPCLGQDASRRVRVGWVRSLVILSILWDIHSRFQRCSSLISQGSTLVSQPVRAFDCAQSRLI